MKHVVATIKDGPTIVFVVPDTFEASIVYEIAPDFLREKLTIVEAQTSVLMEEHQVLKAVHLANVAHSKRAKG